MSDDESKLPKIIFFISLLCFVSGISVLYGMVAHRYNLFPVKQLKEVKLVLTEVQQEGGSFHEHVQPTRGQGNGVTVNHAADQDSLILMSGFFENESQVRLVNRDGTVFRKWPLNYLKHFADQEKKMCDVFSSLDVDMHGVHATPQGEIVLNYEYCGTIKLDQCGKVVWTLNEKTHHSLIPAETGGYWLLGRETWLPQENPDRFPPFSQAGSKKAVDEDFILRISEDGKVLKRISIPVLMRENGLEAYLTATGTSFTSKEPEMKPERNEIVHSNKVEELTTDLAGAFPMFQVGDLAISMRQLNFVMVIDPRTEKVKWHQTGPWIRQHDPEFRPDGKISVFNNNAYRLIYKDGHTDLSAPHVTNIMTIDPATRETEVIYGMKPGQEMLSVIRGQHEILDQGGMLITEFDAGRVFEVNANGDIVWEYVNAHDDEFVGEIVNSQLYKRDYFKTSWNECAQ